MGWKHKSLKKWLSDILFTVIVMCAAFGANILLRTLLPSQSLTPMIFVFGVMMIFGIAATIIGCITHAGRVIDNIEKIHKVIEYPTCAYSFTRYTM